MKRQPLWPALACIVFLVTAASAQRNENTLRGKVRSTSGATLNNAMVELRVAGGYMVAQTFTRTDGDFEFANLRGGDYELEVSLSGYETKVQIARFARAPREGFQEVINVEVVLQPHGNTPAGTPGINFVQEVPQAAREAYDKAILKLREGKSDEGIALLHEALATFNDYFQANMALAAELYRTGKCDEAIAPLERARQVNERDGAVYYLFGLVTAKQQKFLVAEFAFREAAKFNANHIGSHYYHALTLIELALRDKEEKDRLANLAEAEQELNRAFEMSNHKLNEVYIQRARIYERRGNKEEAARALEAYLKAEPDAKNADTIRLAIGKLREKK